MIASLVDTVEQGSKNFIKYASNNSYKIFNSSFEKTNIDLMIKITYCLTVGHHNKPSKNTFHSIVRNVARKRLGLVGCRRTSSNQLFSNLSVKTVESKNDGIS